MSTTGAYSIAAGRALSPRMLDVLRLTARGRTGAQTADELGVSIGTVRTVRSAILARLGVPSMAAAVEEAHRRGEL